MSADARANLGYVRRQVAAAARRGARVVHFPEAALSGYAGACNCLSAIDDTGRISQPPTVRARCA